MQYRRFGRTELQMPVFSCGGMRYQQAWKDMPLSDVTDANQQNLENTIRKSIELGINHIETARGYGSSERQLGLILPKFPRDEIIVQTKIAPEESVDTFVKNFEESLERLQLDYVDLLAIHGINNDALLDISVRPGGCLAACRKLQQRGLARHIGFSTHAPLRTIRAAVQHEGDGGFDYINLHWYYIFQHNMPAIIDATERDMGVFIISPSDKGGKLYEPSNKLLELCSPLHPIIFNDLWCLREQKVHTLSVGAARATDFDLHVESLQYSDRVDEVINPIVKRLEAAMAEKVEADLRDPFAALPTFDNIPGEINAQVILWLRNLLVSYDMREYARMRYNMLGKADHWFPGNKADKLDEHDLSGIASESKLGDRLTQYLAELNESVGGEEVKRLSQS